MGNFPVPDDVIVESFRVECDRNIQFQPWIFPENMARQIGNVVRATALAFEQQKILPPVRNVYVDYPQNVSAPKFRITLEFV